MELTEEERRSPLFKKLTAWLAGRHTTLRAQLEPDNDHESTVKIRGQIKEVKFILRQLEGQQPLHVPTKDNYIS